MKYCKSPLSIDDQIALLTSRGLNISDKIKAKKILSNISYYRLRAYTYPFQDNNNPNHPFTKKVSLEEIIDIYSFDRKLRALVFEAIEKIEIAIRTQIIYQWSLNHGSHWQSNISLYRSSHRAIILLSTLQTEIDRESEIFITHYKKQYTDPTDPPSWMSLEVSSFGLLSQIFLQLKKGNEKWLITNTFGLNDIGTMENWMLCLSNVRNICAHHGRLWNRRLTALVKFPSNPRNNIANLKNVLPYKPYAIFVIIRYLLNIIDTNNQFNVELINVVDSCSLITDKEMGFPKNWRTESFWH